LWDTSNSLSWSRPIRSSGEILLNLLKLKLSLKSSGRPDRAPSSDSISLWSSFNSVNLMFHSTRFCKSRFRRKCHQTPSHLTLTVAGPISVLILLYDRSMLFSSCRPTISWNENSVSLLSVMFKKLRFFRFNSELFSVVMWLWLRMSDSSISFSAKSSLVSCNRWGLVLVGEGTLYLRC
jgi:hypothetical protein